jgi:hypothetical protein
MMHACCLQEARKLWQQVCSVQGYAADLALIAEAHALLEGPQEPSLQDVFSSPSAAAQNGTAAAGQHARKQEQQVGLNDDMLLKNRHTASALGPIICQVEPLGTCASGSEGDVHQWEDHQPSWQT